MKLTTDTKKLSAALATLCKVADPKSSMPIIKCVRIAAFGAGGAELVATDLEVTARIKLDAFVATGGEVCADARQLAALVKAHKGADIALELDGSQLRVGDGAMTTLPARDFPSKLPVAAACYPWMDAAAFAELASKVATSMSSDITRYQLCGALVETLPSVQKLRLVATDGHRLTLADASGVALNHKGARKGIVPRKAMQLVTSAAKRAETIGFALTEETFHVELDDRTHIVAKLVNAQFPSYDQVIPDLAGRRTLTLNAAELAHTLNAARASVPKCVGVTLGMVGNAVRVSAEAVIEDEASKKAKKDKGAAPVVASYQRDLEARHERPDADAALAFAIGVSPIYLLDAITALHAETITLTFGAGEQAELDPIRIDANGTTVVIMPVRIGPSDKKYPTAPDAPAAVAAPVEAPAPRASSRKTAPRATAPAPAPKAPAAPASGITITVDHGDGIKCPVELEAPAEAPAPAPVAIPSGVDLLAANVEIMQAIVAMSHAYAVIIARDAATEEARKCYRCQKVKPMGYILDGAVCCRDCREAHRVDYYASRGQEARPRTDRKRGGGYGASAGTMMHIHAENVIVEKV